MTSSPSFPNAPQPPEPPPQQWPAPQGPRYPQQQRPRRRIWPWVLTALLLIFVGLPLGIIIYAGVVGPETMVVSGRQISARYVERISELGLLERGEKIHYFYSDALFDIEDGMYFLTDRKVVLYCADWHEPRIALPFSKIADMELVADESFLTDSTIVLTLDDKTDVTFPVSSEGGGDRRFFEALKAAWKGGGT